MFFGHVSKFYYSNRSYRAARSCTKDFFQFGHKLAPYKVILLAGYATSLGILLEMFDTWLVDKERVVQDHEIVVFDTKDVSLKE